MKATMNGTVIAEAAKDDLISIEGNWYFPPSSVKSELLTESPTPYTCPWKGECQYFNVKDGASWVKDAAFSYPTPYPASFDRVGKDYSGYVVFGNDVQVTE